LAPASSFLPIEKDECAEKYFPQNQRLKINTQNCQPASKYFFRILFLTLRHNHYSQIIPTHEQ
jgi:hypothetical protein